MEYNEAVLSIRDLSVYNNGGGQPVRVLNKVHLEAKRGKVLGIIGGSGSGKTMTCMAALGLLPSGFRISGGSVQLKGRELARLSQKELSSIRGKHISLIMQNPMAAFNPVRTVGSHFSETIRAHSGLKRKEAEERAVHYMEQVGLSRPGQLMNQYSFQLSGGMLQRVMIAIAMAAKPDILIADEPTTALDAGNQKHVLRELDRFRSSNHAAVIVVTHDLGVIAELADEVAVMRRGEIVEYASVRQLFNSPEHPYTKQLLLSRIRSKLTETGSLRQRKDDGVESFAY
ncbi:MAG: hypothetical protein K0S39_1255 [Paenibacillus sp.]|jgi:nickel transport system ATP-binding protein|nr:hypothetical protein [Paenibacillus sp.]